MLVLRTVSGSFPRFRAYHSGPRKNRHSDRPVFTVPGDIRRVQHSLSRPIVGHTPRKLPPFGAISRIIADCALADAPLSYNTRPCVSRGFSKKFWRISGAFTSPSLFIFQRERKKAPEGAFITIRCLLNHVWLTERFVPEIFS